MTADIIRAALIHQSEGASLDQALTRALKGAKSFSPAARKEIVQTLYAVNRHRARLSWHLAQVGAEATPSALLAAWAAMTTHGKSWRKIATVPDQAVMRQVATRELIDAAMPEAVKLECPPALEAALRHALGSDFAQVMTASLEVPPVDLRVNALKVQRDKVIELLARERIAAKPTPYSPWGLRCENGAHVSATRCFENGLVEFQDEASQLAAALCDARPGMQVMDFCSGTGGKTLALAASMQNKGHIVACDISDVRLARSKIRLKRAGAENAERIKLPDTGDKPLKKLFGRFHRVLVDAPCSGTGSWRRNPDVRWSAHSSNIEELTALQSKILDRASRFVQPGGHLIYATCSLLTEENEERVRQFLGTHSDFEALSVRDIWQQTLDSPWPCAQADYLKLSPFHHGTDGFFAAILRKATIRA